MPFALNLGNLLVFIKANDTQFNKTMRGVEKRLRKTSKKMEEIGKGLTKSVTAPIAALATGSVFAFAKFDDAMTKSLAIMGNVSEGMQKEMEMTARSIARNGVTSAKNLAESYFFLASAGFTAEQSVKSLGVVERFATAGAFDMALATDLLTDAQSALGLSSKNTMVNMKNMTRLSDMFVGANTLANTSVQQLSEAITNEAGAAIKQYNMDLEEGVALLAAYADQGIKGNVAGSMMARMTRLLIKSINDNSQAFKSMNIDVKEFAETGKNITGVIEGITNAVDGMGPAQKAAALEALGFQARVQQAILPLLGVTGKIREYTAALKKMKGLTEEVYKKQLKSFSAQMLNLWRNIQDVGIEIGDVLAPIILKLNKVIQFGIDGWRGLNKELKSYILFAGLATAATGPLLLIFGKITNMLANTVLVIAFLPTAIAKVIAGFIFLKGSIITMVVTLQGAALAFLVFTEVVAVALLGLAIGKYFHDEFESVQVATTRTMGFIKRAWVNLGFSFNVFVDSLIWAFSKFAEHIDKSLVDIKFSFNVFMNTLAVITNFFAGGVKKALVNIEFSFTVMAEGIKFIWLSILNFIQKKFANVMRWMAKGLKKIEPFADFLGIEKVGEMERALSHFADKIAPQKMKKFSKVIEGLQRERQKNLATISKAHESNLSKVIEGLERKRLKELAKITKEHALDLGKRIEQREKIRQGKIVEIQENTFAQLESIQKDFLFRTGGQANFLDHMKESALSLIGTMKGLVGIGPEEKGKKDKKEEKPEEQFDMMAWKMGIVMENFREFQALEKEMFRGFMEDLGWAGEGVATFADLNKMAMDDVANSFKNVEAVVGEVMPHISDIFTKHADAIIQMTSDMVRAREFDLKMLGAWALGVIAQELLVLSKVQFFEAAKLAVKAQAATASAAAFTTLGMLPVAAAFKIAAGIWAGGAAALTAQGIATGALGIAAGVGSNLLAGQAGGIGEREGSSSGGGAGGRSSGGGFADRGGSVDRRDQSINIKVVVTGSGKMTTKEADDLAKNIAKRVSDGRRF